GAAEELQRLEDRLRHLRPALVDTPRADSALFTRMEEIEASVADLRVRLMGDRIRGRWDEPSVPSVLQRISQVAGSQWDNRLLPTATQRQSLAVAQTKFAAVSAELSTLLETELPRFEADLEAAGAPWTPGRKLPPPTPAGSPFF
ncbi:MAG: glycosyl hydrolase, partial [Thermoanaerobaculia bacterium]